MPLQHNIQVVVTVFLNQTKSQVST